MATPIEANVVLTADTTQYSDSMGMAADNTATLGASVDSLGQKLDKIAKSAGRSMFKFAAADTAGITATTAAYAAFERQMTSLNVQANTLYKTTTAQNKAFQTSTKTVNSLRGEFGTATRDAAALVTSLNKVADGTASVDSLAESYTRLGAATGESSVNLAQAMTQLQRTMGVPQRDTEKLNNQLLVLSQNTNASAGEIVNFAQSIAPVGRMVGISQRDITSFSSAFIKAGQDGYRAGNVFNRLMSDIAYATQSGSPDLKKYANLVGMTAGQFKELGGSDKFLKIFESINQQGPRAITTLNQMGLDGMQTVRTVTAMAQQSGGLQSAIAQGRNADPNALKRGSEAALSGIVDQLAKLRSETAMTGEAIGAKFAGPTKMFIGGIEKMAGALHMLADSPLGTLAAWATGTTAALALLGGTLFMTAKALLAFSTANLFLNNSLTKGIREGVGMAPGARAAALASGVGTYGVRVGQGTGLGAEGARIAEQGNFVSRGAYNIGARMGLGVPGYIAGGPGSGPGMFSRMAGYGLSGTGWAARNLIGSQYTPGSQYIPGVAGTGGLNDPDRRFRFFKASTWGEAAGRFGESFRGGVNAAGGRLYADSAALKLRETEQAAAHTARTAGVMSPDYTKAHEAVSTASTKFVKALNASEQATMSAGKGLNNFARGLGNMSMMIGSAGLGAARTAGSIGRSAMSGLGLTPWTLGIMGGIGGIMAIKGMQDDTTYRQKEFGGSINPYLEAAGRQPITASTSPWTLGANKVPRSVSDAMYVSRSDFAYANNPDYELTNSELKGKSKDEAIAFLAPQFNRIKGDRKSLGIMATDLASEFSPYEANEILKTLASGEADPVATYTAKAFNPSSRGPMGILGDDFNDVEDAYARIHHSIEEGAAYASQTYGTGAYEKAQLMGVSETLAAFVKAGGASKYTTTKDGKRAVSSDQDKAFQQFLNTNYLGETFNIEDLNKSRAFTSAGDSTEMLRTFLEENYFAPDVSGPEGVSKADQLNFLSSQGVNKGVLDKGPAAAADAVIGKMTANYGSPDDKNSLASRLEKMQSGFITATDKFVDAAYGDKVGNANAKYQAVNEGYQSLLGEGLGPAKIQQRLTNMMAEIGTPEDEGYQLLAAMQQRNMRDVAFAMPFKNRTQQFGMQTDLFNTEFAAATRLGPEGEDRKEAAVQAYQSQVMEQYNFFKQQLYQQREYNVMRDRAEDDFNLQRTYQEEDYARQRQYSYEDFNLQRDRAELHFGIQMHRSLDDYNTARKRQEEDFQHQKLLMVKQAAQEMYNVYQRTPVQQTSSADWLLFNAGDQLKDMNTQSSQLKQLRQMGVSKDVIQQMGLTDPKNQQQLDRFLADLSENPELVKKFNSAIKKRLKAAENLVTDESSAQWTEFVRQYRRARQHAQEDFEKQAQRARKDFQMSMSESEHDFKRMMSRQQDQYAITMERQREAYNLTMQRSAEDLERSARTIDGNFEEILTKATKRLSGHAKVQAKAVLQEFRDLKSSTTPVARDLMEALASIFGVKYVPPSHSGALNSGPSTGSGQTHQDGGGGGHTVNTAAGGVIPGWSPGYDNTHFVGPGGQRLNLAGGEAVMVPEWTRQQGGEKAVNAMNHAAKRGYFLGGVMPTQASQVTQHSTSQYPFARWAGDLNDPGQGDYGDPVVSWKPGRVASVTYNGAGHQDPNGSYGRWIVINHSDNSQSWYAHLSKAIVRAQQSVRAGQGIGNVGDWGNTTGAHLHFEIRGGNSALGGNTGFGGGSGQSVDDVLKDYYPGPEKSAEKMSGVHPLRRGNMSFILNRMARAAARKMRRKYGAPGADGPLSHLTDGVDMSSGPVKLGRQMSANAGWTGPQWDSLFQLWQHESSWNPYANNPTSSAYGIPQALVDLHGIKPPYYARKVSGSGASSEYAGGDAATQIKWGLNYIRGAYGSPSNAWRHWQGAHSYGEGGIFKQGQNINVGERGPEAVFPLNDKGAEFIQQIITRTQGGNEAKIGTAGHNQPIAHNMYNTYKIDRSTNFTGPITVQAQDPNQFLHKLKQRQRAQALTQPQLAGAR